MNLHNNHNYEINTLNNHKEKDKYKTIDEITGISENTVYITK